MGRHSHRHLLGGLAKQAENYTVALADTILQVFVSQMQLDSERKVLGALTVGPMEIGPRMDEEAVG